MAAVHSEGHAAAVPSRFAPEGDATRLLYERHQRKILSFCKHQLGSREEAEDAAQITFLNAFRGIKSGTSPEFESAWLFKIAHNVCLTKQRNSYRRQLIEAPSDFVMIEERVPAHESDTDELFGLHAALRVIPEQQRRALLLREWQGLTYKEIADEMRLTQAAVETLLFRARRSLADALTTDPAEKRKRGRPKMTSNIGSFVAALKSLLLGGSVKVAATVATVAATSVVSVTPSVRHDVMDAVGQGHTSHLPAVPAPLPSSHLFASVTPVSHQAPSLKPAARHIAMGASHQTRVATPATRLPTVAAEAQPSAPAERSAAATSPAATPGSSDQLPSVPVPVPASAPAPVSRDAPPAEAEPAAAPTPAVSPSTSSASTQGLTASPVPATATSTTAQPASSKLQLSPTQPVITPVVTTPVVTEATAPTPSISTPKATLQVVNVPAPTPTTPTVTTTPSAPAAPQPTPVQTTTTQPIVTAAPVSQPTPAPAVHLSIQTAGGATTS